MTDHPRLHNVRQNEAVMLICSGVFACLSAGKGLDKACPESSEMRRGVWIAKLTKGHEKRERLSWLSRSFAIFVVQVHPLSSLLV